MLFFVRMAVFLILCCVVLLHFDFFSVQFLKSRQMPYLRPHVTSQTLPLCSTFVLCLTEVCSTLSLVCCGVCIASGVDIANIGISSLQNQMRK